jgi:hypothetical protein
MGYRSDVTIAIYGPVEEMAPLLAAQRMLEASPLTTDKDYVKSYGFGMTVFGNPEIVKHHMILAEFEHVKWYHGYEDVQRWEKLISEASENPALCTEFVRVGEQSDDVEARYTGENCGYFIDVSRQINNNAPEAI